MLGELGLTRVQKQQRIIERLDAAYYLGRALETKSEKDIKNALKFAKVVGFRWTSEVSSSVSSLLSSSLSSSPSL